MNQATSANQVPQSPTPVAEAATRRGPRGGRRGLKGFSLIELVIVVVIIGIIAAIAIPRMSRGSAAAADSALSQNLSLLRNAIDMYQQEHNGQYPQGTGAQVAALLLQYSDIAGANTASTKDTGAAQIIYGPYLRSVPAISVGSNKGATGIAVSNTSGVAATGGTGIAWLYNSVDGTFQAYTGTTTTDSSGRLYSSY
jgi:prepilin-type N-terminal cleavage/methylation domain-containing protein